MTHPTAIGYHLVLGRPLSHKPPQLTYIAAFVYLVEFSHFGIHAFEVHCPDRCEAHVALDNLSDVVQAVVCRLTC